LPSSTAAKKHEEGGSNVRREQNRTKEKGASKSGRFRKMTRFGDRSPWKADIKRTGFVSKPTFREAERTDVGKKVQKTPVKRRKGTVNEK